MFCRELVLVSITIDIAMGSTKHPRFYCMQRPQGWCVWDQSRNEVARLGGFDLRNLPEPRARAACGVLVAIYTRGLDAKTRNSSG